MRLEMYLEAHRHIPPHNTKTEPMRRTIGAAIGYTRPVEKPSSVSELLEVYAVVVRVGYWHGFWPLHNWFVNNMQEGTHPPQKTA